jgi:hypothetical protein
MTSWTTRDTDCGPAPKEPAVPWRVEIEVAIRDGLQCRVCDVPLMAEDERMIVRVDPTAGDAIENLALVCAACRNAHRVHPEPIADFGERLERLT